MFGSSLDALVAAKNGIGRPFLCLEVNPPKGSDLSQLEERLQAPVSEGLDFFNVTDNALAIMRMAALPMAVWLKNRFKIEPLVNLSCRDRNLLGIQSDLLAAEALGLRSVVALTGDAISIGDHAECKGVFEVNSLGVLKVVEQLNACRDLMGNELQGGTNFRSGVVANPNARNINAELKKLARKIEAGARYILTQPVFDEESSQVFLKEAAQFGCPIMLGLMPIGSVKIAQNLEKIPGLRLSPALRDMLGSVDDQSIKKYSLELCLRLAQTSRPYVAGYHIVSGVTPKLALRLLKQLRSFREEMI